MNNDSISSIDTMTSKFNVIKNPTKIYKNVRLFAKKPLGKVMLIGIAIFLLLTFIALIDKSSDEHRTRIATYQLNTIDNQVNEVSTLYQDMNQLTKTITTDNHLTQNEITQLSEEVQAVQTRAQELSDQKDLSQLSQSLSQSNQLLSQKVVDLENNVSDVKQILQPYTFIDPKNLPFKVISLDVWDGTPYATVNIDGEEDLMGLNETRSGWTVDSMDFVNRQIVFKNQKDQYIKFQLEN